MNYLDTSALVRAWRKEQAPDGVTRSHSLAEFYATLTSGLTVNVQGQRTRLQISPTETAEGALATFSAVTFRDLTPAQTLEEVGAAAKANIQGANVHDWMHAAVARREGCKQIVTTNTRHFKEVSRLPLVEPGAA